MLTRRGLQLADDLPRAPVREVGLEPVLERRQPQLLETRDLGLRPGLVRELGERRAAPERERPRSSTAAAAGSLSPLPRPGARSARGRARPSHPKRVAGRHRPEHVAASAFASSATYICTIFGAVAGGVAGPEVVDQPLGRERSGSHAGGGSRGAPGPPAPEGEDATLGNDFEGSGIRNSIAPRERNVTTPPPDLPRLSP